MVHGAPRKSFDILALYKSDYYYYYYIIYLKGLIKYSCLFFMLFKTLRRLHVFAAQLLNFTTVFIPFALDLLFYSFYRATPLKSAVYAVVCPRVCL